jgi:hypothetical protein
LGNICCIFRPCYFIPRGIVREYFFLFPHYFLKIIVEQGIGEEKVPDSGCDHLAREDFEQLYNYPIDPKYLIENFFPPRY